MSTVASPIKRYLRPSQAAEKLGIGLSTLWLKIKTDPDFPEPIKTDSRTTVLVDSELDDYVEKKRARSQSLKGGAE